MKAAVHTQSTIVRAFYLNNGLRELIPIYPLYAIMFTDHGISPIELSLLFSVWCTVGLVFEVPSGALADRYSRKWLVAISGVLKSCAFLTWFLWQDFRGYALGFLLWGAGSTLRSGAWEALLYDLLKGWRREAEFVSIFGRARAFSLVGIGLGELLGGVLIVNGYDTVLLVSMVIPLAATIPFVFLVPDASTGRGDRGQGRGTMTMREILKSGIHEAVANRLVLFVLLVSSLLISCWGIYDEFVSPTIREKGFPLHLVAYLGAVIYLCQSAGHILAARFRAQSVERMLQCTGAASLLLFVAAFARGYAAVAAIAAFAFLFGLAETLLSGRLQHAIGSETRATVTSTVAFAQGVVGIVGFLLFGWVAQYHRMSGGTFATACAVLLLSAAFLWLNRRWRIDAQGIV